MSVPESGIPPEFVCLKSRSNSELCYGIDEKWLDFLLGTLVVFGCVLAQLRIRLRNQTIRRALVGALLIHTISGLIFFAHFDRPKGIWLAVVDIVEIVAISTAIDRLASRSSN